MTRKLVVIALVVIVGVGVDLLAGTEPPGIGAVLGLTGTFVLTFGSKWLAAVLKRPEDYYDHQDLPWPSATQEGEHG
jgi:hypothetical protein